MPPRALITPLPAVLGLILGLGTGKAEPSGGTTTSGLENSTNQSVTNVSNIADTNTARVSSLSSLDVIEYPELSAPVQQLLSHGLDLTRQNLFYKYGSDDPSAGGMDCSGTIHYLLEQAGIKDVPRDASEMYEWAWKAGGFQAVVSTNPATFELSRLQPGDLLFWTGTYRVAHDPPVTHVMIYLGTSRLTGRRVMVGASDGRTFNGQPRFGVSVFDFKLPGSNQTGDRNSSTDRGQGSRFIGYSPVPGLDKTASSDLPASRSLPHG